MKKQLSENELEYTLLNEEYLYILLLNKFESILYIILEKAADLQISEENIEEIVYINPDILYSAFTEVIPVVYSAGVQNGKDIIEMKKSLNDETDLYNRRAIEALLAYHYELSSKVSREISDSIKEAILVGIRDGDGIPEIMDKILLIYNEPIPIYVPAKYDNAGNLLRIAHTRYVSPQYWAEMVSRTEIHRAFLEGRHNEWSQSGIVDIVILQVAYDERTCAECMQYDGQEFTLEEAHGFLPLHPFCRCTFVPVLNYKILKGYKFS
jgi:SPP1 gp7 family putative phage head morphogenesis protein